MKIRVYLFGLFVLIILLFFGCQFVLIFVTIYDLLRGIEFDSFDIKLNKSEGIIPHEIHQMWKTINLSTYPINTSHENWKMSYPNYKMNLWTDKQIEELISGSEYKYLYSIYKSYFYSIQRADLARLIILHFQGGIYVDLDVYPSETNLEELISRDASFIIGRSSKDICLINHFLISEKHSYIINLILHEIHQKSLFNQIYILPYLEVFSTGSIFLTNIIRKRISSKDKLVILSRDQLSKYIFHDAGRSWHLIDGYLINQIDAHPNAFLIGFFSLFFLCFIRFTKYFTIFNKFKFKNKLFSI